jgi:hypothetical protein
VPAYAEYADRVLGPGGSDRLLVEFRAGSPGMQAHARLMFERWSEVAELTASQAVGAIVSWRAARR